MMKTRIYTSLKSFMMKENTHRYDIYPDPSDSTPPEPYSHNGFNESGNLVLELFIGSTMNDKSENIPIEEFKKMVIDFEENLLKPKLNELKNKYKNNIWGTQILNSPLIEDNWSEYSVENDMVILEGLIWLYSIEYSFERMPNEIDHTIFQIEESKLRQFIEKYDYLKSYDYEESSESDFKNNY